MSIDIVPASNGEENEPLLRAEGPIVLNIQGDKLEVRYCWVTMILIAVSYAFTSAPLISIYEATICKHYERKGVFGGLPDMMVADDCKDELVQKELNLITSVQIQLNLWTCK
jgi:hypothetical protein